MSTETRRSLSRFIATLYEGGAFNFRSDEGSRALCFRLKDEELPSLPGDEETFGATQSGVFLTFEQRFDNRPSKRRWMGCGSLDDLHITLSDLGNIDELMEDFLQQISFRHAMGVPVMRGFIEIPIREQYQAEAKRPIP